MPQGLQVFDANGVLTMDINDFVAKIVGSFATQAGVSGSITVAAPGSSRKAFIIKQAQPPIGIKQGSAARTEITVSGLNISWTAGRDSMLVLYGVF